RAGPDAADARPPAGGEPERRGVDIVHRGGKGDREPVGAGCRRGDGDLVVGGDAPRDPPPAGPGGQHRQPHRLVGARHLEGHVDPLPGDPPEVPRVTHARRIERGVRAEAAGRPPPAPPPAHPRAPARPPPPPPPDPPQPPP